MEADYKKAVADHMATAPVELREYVCRRLTGDNWWYEGKNPIGSCGFRWYDSRERLEFWDAVYFKEWQRAMDTDFWKSRPQQDTQQVTSEQ